jgi:hypothetical protein
MLFTNTPHQWCNGKSARLECDGSWVQGHVGSNQRLHLVFTASPLSARKSARLECDGSWVQGHVGSNQRLYIYYLLLLH